MNAVAHSLDVSLFFVLILGWLLFTVVFLKREKPPQTTESKRDRSSNVGIATQMIGFALVWSVRRPMFSPMFNLGWPFDIATAVITTTLVVCSIWIVTTAVRTLGKQWSLTARLVEGHALITEGPYQIVRHPIYTGMFGMMLATGLVMTYWFILVAAIAIFLTGTSIRTRSEEGLLRNEFGAAYENYARKTPALIPWPLNKG
jgi:protein-S-isoprenylcysteine O-methyltransferase Ste14